MTKKNKNNLHQNSKSNVDTSVSNMKDQQEQNYQETQNRFEAAYESEKPKFLNRLRAAGRSLEEAEDMVHDLYAETMERLPILDEIRNFPAWLNSLFSKRIIDAWRHRQVKKAAGETQVAEETLVEIISETGLDPLDQYVRECLLDALNDALRLLPSDQKKVIEAQVFGGLTFREIAAQTGQSIDTLTARKRYAIRNLSVALRHWIED